MLTIDENQFLEKRYVMRLFDRAERANRWAFATLPSPFESVDRRLPFSQEVFAQEGSYHAQESQ